MTSTALLGCTGMVGSIIYATLCSAAPVSSIVTLSRKQPPVYDTKGKAQAFVEKDTEKWIRHMANLEPGPEVLFSAMATTAGAAGGFESQYKIEHDLNLDLARAAKNAGTKVYVLISAATAHPQSRIAYSRMKGKIEHDIQKLDFEHTIIIRPGLIGGVRKESRPAEAFIRKVADLAGAVSGNRLKDFWAQDADVIARAAVTAGLQAAQGKVNEKVWILGQPDIIRIGRTEYVSFNEDAH